MTGYLFGYRLEHFHSASIEVRGARLAMYIPDNNTRRSICYTEFMISRRRQDRATSNYTSTGKPGDQLSHQHVLE